MAGSISAYRLLPLLVVGLGLLGHPTEVGAGYFSASQGPGPLSPRHRTLVCDQCHAANHREVLLPKCLACHAPLAAERATHRGLHGNPAIASQPCLRCHGEHRAQPEKIIGFSALGGTAHFDHQLTGYALAGGHRGVACARCHPTSAATQRPSYLNTPILCQRCHVSPHGEMRQGLDNCQRCHSVAAWKPALTQLAFNHQLDTQYPLGRQHAQVPCLSCHVRSQYVLGERAADCSPCHAVVHGKSILSNHRCTECHRAEVGWQTVHFAHRHSSFRLGGQHAKVACRACHRGQGPAQFEDLSALIRPGKSPNTSASPLVDCRGCHQHRDAHQGKFTSSECLKCHREPGVEENRLGKVAWREQAAITHGPGTAFTLTGGHDQVPCARCHPQGRFQKLMLQCGPQCHADVHRAALGTDCLRCHAGGKWQAAGFDHQQSRFPLTGLHRQTACVGCHPEPTYKPRPSTCGATECHHSSDPHNGHLGNECARCHDTTAWTSISKAHEVTPIPFGGAHDQLPCVRCHAQGRRLSGMAGACIACHQHDDIHNNSLGPRCSDCHSQQSFVGARFSHDTFGCRLRGIHRILPCVDCHKGGNYFGLSPSCVSCHRDDALRALRDPLLSSRMDAALAHASGSTSCSGCHNTSSFHSGSRGLGSAGDSVCQ